MHALTHAAAPYVAIPVFKSKGLRGGRDLAEIIFFLYLHSFADKCTISVIGLSLRWHNLIEVCPKSVRQLLCHVLCVIRCRKTTDTSQAISCPICISYFPAAP